MTTNDIITLALDRAKKQANRYSGKTYTLDEILSLSATYSYNHPLHITLDPCKLATVITERLGRKYKSVLDKLLPLVDYIDRIAPTYYDTYREFYLASTNSVLIKSYTNHQNVSNMIKHAKKIGLLILTDNISIKGEHGKGYVYVPYIASIIRTLANDYPADITTPDEDTPEEAESITSSLDNVSFRSHSFGRLKATDSDIIDALHRKYPYLAEYEEKARLLSNRLGVDILDMTFRPSIKRGSKGYVSKIGIRAYSPICGTPHGSYRDELLQERLGWDNVYAYDVKSSIYRVSYAMRYGQWLPDTQDFYAMMQEPLADKLTRDNAKSFAMRLYFGGSSNKILHNMTHRVDLEPTHIDTLRRYIDTARDAMRDTIGESYGSEVFLYESCIYIDLALALLDKGIRVATVYDAFYSDDSRLASLCRELLPVIAANFRSTALGEPSGIPTAHEPQNAHVDPVGAFIAGLLDDVSTTPITGDAESESARAVALLDSIDLTAARADTDSIRRTNTYYARYGCWIR